MFKRVWEFPWLPLQINHPSADVFMGCPAAGFDLGGGNHPKSWGEEGTRAPCPAITSESCYPLVPQEGNHLDSLDPES